MGRFSAQGETAGRNPALFEHGVVARGYRRVIELSGLKDKPAGGNTLKKLAPEGDHRMIYFAQIVETAERNMALRKCRQGRRRGRVIGGV